MAAPQQPGPGPIPTELNEIRGIPEVLAWLGTAESPDPGQDLLLLRSHLASVAKADLPVIQFHRLLDLFFERAQRLSQALEPYLAAALPLERPVRAVAEGLQEINGLLARGYVRVMDDIDGRLVRNKRRNPVVIAARALKNLANQLHTSICIASPPPAELWLRAHQLYRTASRHGNEDKDAPLPGSTIDAEVIYKGMLAQAAAQPEGFSPAESALLQAYLQRHAPMVDLFTERPADGSASWYWLDTERDAGPVPSNRRIIPQNHGSLLFVSCVRLARHLEEHLTVLGKGASLSDLKLPDVLPQQAAVGFLRRVQQHWSSPPHRHFSRRQHNYRAHLCVGLDDLWHLLHSGKAPAGTGIGPVRTTEWMVMNESAAGFAVIHVAGEVEGLRTGSVIALRSNSEHPWYICIVRWMRSENPEHIELGLELVAPNAQSVSLIFRNGKPDQKPTPGLLLPPVRALRQHPAIVAPSGSYSSRRFFIVRGDDKTHVSQGRLLSLDMQTDSVELFQFEADPYPA
ncbi:MAG: hypothetical protein ACOZB1_13975 [Pseudomonadota bacterium]|jgi:hypothetical protein